MLDLINKVLDVASVESGEIKLSCEPVQIKPVFEEIFTYSHSIAEKKDIKIIDETSGFDEYYILLDKARFKQVMSILVSNAVKYNTHEGSVTFYIQNINNSRLRFCVKDTGSGIPATLLPNVFELFNHLGSETLQVEGVGLGLCVAKNLVELMDGRIEVGSIPNVGTTVYVELPICDSPT